MRSSQARFGDRASTGLGMRSGVVAGRAEEGGVRIYFGLGVRQKVCALCPVILGLDGHKDEGGWFVA